MQDKPGQCTRKSTVDQFKCLVCTGKGKAAIYNGETSRTSFEKVLVPQALVDAGSLESPMVEHQVEEHLG